MTKVVYMSDRGWCDQGTPEMDEELALRAAQSVVHAQRQMIAASCECVCKMLEINAREMGAAFRRVQE